jgi:hypothetical protein
MNTLQSHKARAGGGPSRLQRKRESNLNQLRRSILLPRIHATHSCPGPLPRTNAPTVQSKTNNCADLRALHDERRGADKTTNAQHHWHHTDDHTNFKFKLKRVGGVGSLPEARAVGTMWLQRR